MSHSSATTRIPGGNLSGVLTITPLFGRLLLSADQNQFVHFFKKIAMTGGLLQVVAFGAGSFSLDARAR